MLLLLLFTKELMSMLYWLEKGLLEAVFDAELLLLLFELFIMAAAATIDAAITKFFG